MRSFGLQANRAPSGSCLRVYHTTSVKKEPGFPAHLHVACLGHVHMRLYSRAAASGLRHNECGMARERTQMQECTQEHEHEHAST